MFFEYSDESKEWYTIVVIGIALPAAFRALSSFFEKLVWQKCTHYLCGADPITECIQPSPRRANQEPALLEAEGGIQDKAEQYHNVEFLRGVHYYDHKGFKYIPRGIPPMTLISQPL